MHGCVIGWMHACMNAWMHALMHAWIHAWMHTFMHGCVHGCAWLKLWTSGPDEAVWRHHANRNEPLAAASGQHLYGCHARTWTSREAGKWLYRILKKTYDLFQEKLLIEGLTPMRRLLGGYHQLFHNVFIKNFINHYFGCQIWILRGRFTPGGSLLELVSWFFDFL